jgi:hypothetical protein
VLRANQASIQLTIEGADLTVGPVAITFLVSGFDAVAKARDQLPRPSSVAEPCAVLRAAALDDAHQEPARCPSRSHVGLLPLSG